MDANYNIELVNVYAAFADDEPYSGQPTVFCILGKCAKNCIGCNILNYNTIGQITPVDVLFDIIQRNIIRYSLLPCIITGADIIDKFYAARLLKDLRRFFQTIIIETTGYKSFYYDLADYIILKLFMRSNVAFQHRINPAVIRKLVDLPHCFVKVYINNDEDMEVFDSLYNTFKFLPRKLIISANTDNQDILHKFLERGIRINKPVVLKELWQ